MDTDACCWDHGVDMRWLDLDTSWGLVPRSRNLGSGMRFLDLGTGFLHVATDGYM